MPLLEVDKWSTPIISSRLILRPFLLKDLGEYLTILSEPEVATLAYKGGEPPSYDLRFNLESFITKLRPWATSRLNYGIFMKISEDKEGKLLGECTLNTGVQWPELSYMFKKEYWGQGYGTEAVKAFMEFWWSLPRHVAKLSVHPGTVVKSREKSFTYSSDASTLRAKELVLALIEKGNEASKNVLIKAGFEHIEEMDEKELLYFRKIIPHNSPKYYRELYFKRG
jgi:RimJ/RimL family protein N-acetyltransferase